MRAAPRSKTLDVADLRSPGVEDEARRLRRFVRRLFLRGVPLAINGIAHRRFYVREAKLWEYASGLAPLAAAESGRMDVLELGGAAGVPSAYLAARGERVRVLDLNPRLVALGQATAERRGWDLDVRREDLTRGELPPGWGPFDAAVSFCVIEHMQPDAHRRALARMASALRPGGKLAFTFEFGEEAPGEGALRDAGQVEELVAFLGLHWSGAPFQDSGQRFVLDRRHAGRRFTFGIVHLEKRG